VKVFWALDSQLAYRRHFPAINWLTSYSLYADEVADDFIKDVDKDWFTLRTRAMAVLEEEARLEEIVRLVGQDALSPRQRITLEFAKSIREDFLQQIAFDPEDTYTSPAKQAMLMRSICSLYDGAYETVTTNEQFNMLIGSPIRERIAKGKYQKEPANLYFDELQKDILNFVSELGEAK
jgi:V/A-type H+-transporting ATPase subunit A